MGERKIVTIHSYRGGTGKSNMTANIAVCAQAAGKRVAVLDADLQSPGIHILFNFDQERIKLTLYDFLRGKCTIAQVVYDVRTTLQRQARHPFRGEVKEVTCPTQPSRR